MSTPTITMDSDKKCAECGKGGAGGNGLCIGCTSRAISLKPMQSPEGRLVRHYFENLKRKEESPVSEEKAVGGTLVTALGMTLWAELRHGGGNREAFEWAARACLEAIERAGWQCVPKEATEEMLAASNREWDGRMSARSACVWQAMCAAAPQP